MPFDILKTNEDARLGVLELNGIAIQTPNFIAPSSRGCVPHVTPDNLLQILAVAGIYTAFEDCM